MTGTRDIGIRTRLDLTAVMRRTTEEGGPNDPALRSRMLIQTALIPSRIHSRMQARLAVTVITNRAVRVDTADLSRTSATEAVAIALNQRAPRTQKRNRSQSHHPTATPPPAQTPTSKWAPTSPLSLPMARPSTLAHMAAPCSPAKARRWPPTCKTASAFPDEERSDCPRTRSKRTKRRDTS